MAVCLRTLSQMQQVSELVVDCGKASKILLLQTIIESLLLPGKNKHELNSYLIYLHYIILLHHIISFYFPEIVT